MEDAKFVLSKSKILEQYNKVKSLSDIVSYSSKTNQDVTKILEEETDCMFSVHLVNELKHLKDKSRALFIAQAWNNDFIFKLITDGIRNFVVDNEYDLDTLLKFLKNYDVSKFGKINLLLRLKLKENSIRTEKYFVFGMRADVINKRLSEINKINKINEIGIHFHRKTQNMSEWNLIYELNNIISEENWNIIDIVNIGGGLPSVYANTNIDVFDSIFKKVVDFKEFLNMKKIKLIIEPGRFIAAPSGKLVTEIMCIDENNITVNASVYNSDMDAIIVPVKLLVDGELSKIESQGNDEIHAYVIKGITPCSMDIFRYKVYLKKPKIGDKLVFINAGAYNFFSDFCDLEKLKTEVVE